MSGASTLTIAGRSGAGRGPDPQPGNALSAIADVPACEQDRLLAEHSEAVADHMANHFSRRTPHLAASSGFARWQRAAGVAAALGVIALLVIAPLVLLIVLAGAITAITAAHVVIAVASRGRRPGALPPALRPGPGRRPSQLHDPGAGLPGAGRDRRHGAVPGEPRLPQGPAGGADPGRATRSRHQAGDRATRTRRRSSGSWRSRRASRRPSRAPATPG